MLRFIALAVAIALMIGCRAPTPSFKMLTPGATRIPPPATDSYRKADSYYPGPTITAPPVGTGTKSSTIRRNGLTQNPTTLLDKADPASSEASSRSVAAASFERPVTSSSSRSREPQIQIVDASSLASSPRSSSTEPFRAASRVVEISELPRANPAPIRASGSQRSTSSASSSATPNQDRSGARADRSSWRAREDDDTHVRFAGR